MIRPYGYFTEAEGEAYSKLVRGIREGTVVELGVFKGLSLSYIIAACQENNNRLVGVDDWRWRKDENVREDFFGWLDSSQYLDAVEIIEKDCVEAVNEFEDASLDLVMVDTDHFYEPFKEQAEAWLPKIKPGGIFCGHDYNDRWFKLKRGIHEILGEPQNLVDSFWWFEIDSL